MSLSLEGIVTVWTKATTQQKAEIGRAVEQVFNGKTAKSIIQRIVRRSEAAELLGVTPKRIDQLSRTGILKRIYAPGTVKAIGVSESSLRALTEQGSEVPV